MKLYDKLTSELNEALWKISDIATDDNDNSDGGGGKAQRPQDNNNKKNQKNDQDNEDQDNKDGEENSDDGDKKKKSNKKDDKGTEDENNSEDGEDDGEDGSKKGNGSKKGGKPGNEKGEDTETTSKEKSARDKLRDYIKKGIKDGTYMHEDDKFFNPTSKDMKKAFSASYKKVRRELGPRPHKTNGQPGDNEGDLMDVIDSYVDSAEVDVKSILKNKLMKFAALYNQSRSQSYGAHIQSSVSRMTGGRDIGSRNKPFMVDQPESAIVLFGLDTSGSVWSQPGAIEAAAGLLNDVFNSFKTQLKTKGDVFKFMWDTAVHEASFSLWRNEKTFSAHGGGGTDPQAVFDWIDNNFAEVTVNGRTYKFSDLPSKTSIQDVSKVDFVWDPKAPIFKILGPEFQNNYKNPFRVSTKPDFSLYNSINKMSDKDIEKHINSVMNKQASYLPGLDKMGKVPFLILFTDGEMTKPDVGNLYKTYPGNVFWVITTKHGLANTNPPNALYLDVEELIEKYGKKKK